MQRWIHSITIATVLLALSATAQSSVNPDAARDLVASEPETSFAVPTGGETMLLAQAKQNKENEKSVKSQTQAQKSQGYEKSGNPKAAGGPQNPGKGKPQKPSGVRPEQPIEKPKPEQPIEDAKPEQPIAPPQPEPRDKDGIG